MATSQSMVSRASRASQALATIRVAAALLTIYAIFGVYLQFAVTGNSFSYQTGFHISSAIGLDSAGIVPWIFGAAFLILPLVLLVNWNGQTIAGIIAVLLVVDWLSLPRGDFVHLFGSIFRFPMEPFKALSLMLLIIVFVGGAGAFRRANSSQARL